MTKTCLKCREVAHAGLTCIQANPPKAIHALEESMSAALIRTCPSCRKEFVKESGCNMVSHAAWTSRARRADLWGPRSRAIAEQSPAVTAGPRGIWFFSL